MLRSGTADAEAGIIDRHEQGFALAQDGHHGALADAQVAQTGRFGLATIEAQHPGGLPEPGATQGIAMQFMLRVGMLVNTALSQNSFDHDLAVIAA